MNERECQARLHPHTGQVEVYPDLKEVPAPERRRQLNDAPDEFLLRALLVAYKTIEVLAQEKNLGGALAYNTLEQLEALRKDMTRELDIEEMRR